MTRRIQDDYAKHLRTRNEGEITDENEAAVDRPHPNDTLADRRARDRHDRGGLVGRDPERSPLTGASRTEGRETTRQGGATTGLSRHARQPNDDEMNPQHIFDSAEKARRRSHD